MAIRIELDEVKKLTMEGLDIQTEMKSDLSRIASLLVDICNNVQSNQLTYANANVTNTIQELVFDLNTLIPATLTFLNKQVLSYEKTNVNTKEGIDALVSTVNSSFGQN